VDVLLMLTSDAWCIGKSCTLMVFEGTPTGARMQAEITLIASPVAVGDLQANGWRELFVTLPGASGSSSVGRIAHDGTSYPENPSSWRFLAKGTPLPGRPVLVGGGAAGSDLAGVERLLATADTAPSAPVQPTTSQAAGGKNFYGRYSWGPGEAYFRPCGGNSVYWVTAEDEAAVALDQQYRQTALQQFDDVYLEMRGDIKPTPSDGEASFYDGVLDIQQVLSMSAVNADTCSQVPRF